MCGRRRGKRRRIKRRVIRINRDSVVVLLHVRGRSILIVDE
jgi:hypothetical protein